MDEPILKMKGISKEFPGVKALNSVDFELYPGEIHALMGENGAGKSTLMKILSGVYPATSGKIIMNGEEVTISNPSDAQNLGISIIHQEFNLFPNLTAAENIYINQKSTVNKFGKINWKKIYNDAQDLIRSIGADFDVRKEVQYLSVHSHQVIEIAKALSLNAKVLIMDEPSAALPEDEVQKMFNVVRKLKNNGVAIVYVSHRMKEILEIADKVTVLRDGKKVTTDYMKETSQDQIISNMIGRNVDNLYPEKITRHTTETVLKLDNLDLTKKHRVSFELKKGEILGIFGLVGSGTNTLAKRIFGLKTGTESITVNGKQVKVRNPRDAMKLGIAYLPPNRHAQGIIKELSIQDNMTLPILKELSKMLQINEIEEKELANSYIDQLNIKTPSSKQSVNLLSGGNQQKVVLGKWLATEPGIFIMEEPTRGVDVGAKSEIYQIIDELSKEGLSIILISTEMPELLGMSDRILVMNEGKLVSEYKYGEADQHTLLRDASNSEEGMVI